MNISEATSNLIGLIPQSIVIIDITNQLIIYNNDKSRDVFGLVSGLSSDKITDIMYHITSPEAIYAATRAELQKFGKCILNHINIKTATNQIEHYDIHISYVDNDKKAVYLIFALSDHELNRMMEQNMYYDNLSEATYSYPFYLDINAKRMELFNPELEEFKLSMSMDNFPQPVLDSGVLCEDDIDDYLEVVKRMYRGAPPQGSFRCYDPKGELLKYTTNYVVNRDECGNPIEITGDFIIESETKLDSEMNMVSDTTNTTYTNSQPKVVLAHQIKAHFFFNTLNTISALCKQDAAKADSAIRTFATYMRSYMHLINENENIAFEQELTLVKSTLEIEKLRFPESFIYEFDLEVKDFKIPPLTLQPLVENALLHGLRRTGHHGTLTITSKKIENFIYINVTDNGLGFDTAILNKTKSIGIKNLTKRIELMVDGTVSIQSELGKGSTSTIKIPVSSIFSA